MKNKLLAGIICIVTVCSLIVHSAPIYAESTNTVGEANSLIDGIVSFKLSETNSSSVQDWIDGYLTEKAGVLSEWYIIALSQNESYDLSDYRASLEAYVSNNNVSSAVTRQKYALALAASGSVDSFIDETLEDSIGKQGIMSWIFGLHLLNNGYVSDSVSNDTVKKTLLSLQLEDGGWAITGSVSDVDVTAMTIQSLAPYYNTSSEVKTAIDSALSLLSSRQLDDGDFSSYGVSNPESTAQVLTALSALNIDAATDSRFIKNSNTVIDGLKKYRLSDGSYSHILNEASNELATVQTLYSLVSYIRMTEGKSGLHILDNRILPVELPTEDVHVTPDEEETVKIDVAADTTDEDTVKQETTDEHKENDAPTKLDDALTELEVIEKDTQSENTKQIKDEAEKVAESTEQTGNDENVSQIRNDEPDDAAEAEQSQDTSDKHEKAVNYKALICICVAIAAITTCIVLFAMKKRNRKNFIAIFVTAVIIIVVALCVDIQSADSYYNSGSIDKENAVGTVTMTIRCDTIVGRSESEYIPKDGVILEETEFYIDEDDTVYDILIEAARGYSIQMENTGSGDMAYIAGINYLYEFDFGDLSGWMYYVNGEAPSVGCDKYFLLDGDTVEWLYTCDLGNDLK